MLLMAFFHFAYFSKLNLKKFLNPIGGGDRVLQNVLEHPPNTMWR
jgi:hypothetical protein